MGEEEGEERADLFGFASCREPIFKRRRILSRSLLRLLSLSLVSSASERYFRSSFES